MNEQTTAWVGDEPDAEMLELEHRHPLWRKDRVTLRSVGIDIGSSTTHLVISTIEVRRQSAALSSRFELVGRHVDYASPILLTPFVAGTSIDIDRLSGFIAKAYAEASIAAEEIDTGATITTGDAARKDNAAAVVRMFAAEAGKFVCASAGPMLEAKMAAYGSGAVARSNAGGGCTVLNIDIGGGTSKLAIASEGRIVEATAMNVGARLVTYDAEDRVTKIEPAAAIAAREAGVRLSIGERVTPSDRGKLAAFLVGALIEVAARRPLSAATAELMIGSPLLHAGPIDVVMVSGGVSEYLTDDAAADFGDLGRAIAADLRRRLSADLGEVVLEPAVQGIRATVIGASQFTAQVSGSTLHISSASLLPIRNLQVVPVEFGHDQPTSASVEAAVRASLSDLDLDNDDAPVALAVRWPFGPAYPLLDALSSGVAGAIRDRVGSGHPLVLVIDADIARLVGNLMSRRLGPDRDVICIDGVDLQEFDYIDIGEQLAESNVVTVIVKSLVFTG